MKIYEIGDHPLSGYDQKHFLGGLISGVASLAGGAINSKSQSSTNKTNMQIAQMNNQANQQLQKQQNEWNLNQWNRENEYNSASAQRKRLEDAGYNPFFATGQVAAGSATASQLESAPYTPMQTPNIQPVTGFGTGVSNAGNDFLNGMLNYRMNKAAVQKAEADADKSSAEASATRGYRREESQASTAVKRAESNLVALQAESTRLQNDLTAKFGSKERAMNLSATLQNIVESKSRQNLNYKQIEQLASNIIVNAAKANNLNIDSSQKASMTKSLVELTVARAVAQQQQNRILSNEADFDNVWGDQKRHAGLQQLKSQSNIASKDDENYWAVKLLQTAPQLGNIASKVMLKGK